jgi:formamidopyrimidine-DNA glycosylase
MPELPDIEAYLAAMRPRLVGEELTGVRVSSISLLKTFDPPLEDAFGRTVEALRRLGKRIVFELGDELFLVLHLMVAGRLLWKDPNAKIPAKIGQAAFDFPNGTLLLTEAGTKKRASLHLIRGTGALGEHDRGGIDVATASPQEFAERLRSERHTLKRALTDPRLFSGIGGAYSDEVLHRARLSPLARSDQLDDATVEALRLATIEVLAEWTDRLVAEAEGDFPTGVTAFRPEMAVHGRFGQPCPDCGSPVQRIRYASNETNYCATCQTDGKLLADRAMSRLLKDDWPKSLDEL